MTPDISPNWVFFAYGMGLMYYTLMAWLFWFRSKGRAKHMIAILMAIIALQYIKDLFFIDLCYTSPSCFISNFLTASDFVAVPFYGYILVELCRPGSLKLRHIVLSLCPFILLPILYAATHLHWIFTILIALSTLYGIACAGWMVRELPRYHRRLKDEYSYDDNINLHWLRGVTILFFTILLFWVWSCFAPSMFSTIAYMFASLAGWMVVCYFIYRQEIVINEVRDTTASRNASIYNTIAAAVPHDEENPSISAESAATLKASLTKLFEEEHLYLEPKLRLADLALQLGTNRTYLSQYFNQCLSVTFYEFVNNYRLAHAERLLRTTDYTLEVVAHTSGFNSLSTFRRAFMAKYTCSPQAYRAQTTP